MGGQWHCMPEVADRLTAALTKFAGRNIVWWGDLSGSVYNGSSVLDGADGSAFHPSGDHGFEQHPVPTAIKTAGSTQYRPTREEQDMSASRLDDDDPLTAGLPDSSNGVHIMRDGGGRLVVHKPADEENFESISWIRHEPGELAKREVAAYRISRLLGFDLVPPTGLVPDGPYGNGSVQQYRILRPEQPANQFDAKQQQQAAVLHYIIGTPDGRASNYRPDENGNLVLFDNGYAFPEALDSVSDDDIPFEIDSEWDDDIPFQIDSDFVNTHRGATLDDDILNAVDAVTAEQVHSALGDLGLGHSAVGVANRLAAIKSARTIPASDTPD